MAPQSICVPQLFAIILVIYNDRSYSLNKIFSCASSTPEQFIGHYWYTPCMRLFDILIPQRNVPGC